LVITSLIVEVSSCSVKATYINVASSANKGLVILDPEAAGSTKFLILEVVATAFGRSLIKIEKRVEPNSEPWGPPGLS
jgi:hypothetical protein